MSSGGRRAVAGPVSDGQKQGSEPRELVSALIANPLFQGQEKPTTQEAKIENSGFNDVDPTGRDKDFQLRRPLRNQRLRRGIYILPSIFTVANLLCGYYAILATLAGSTVDFETRRAPSESPFCSILSTGAWRAQWVRTANSGSSLIRWLTS